jgi:hypothetical protein
MIGVSPDHTPAKGSGPDWPSWLEDLYDRADGLDAAGFAAGLGASGTMRFANAPVLSGVAAIEESLRAFFAQVTSMRHRILRVWEHDADTIFEALVTYGLQDGQLVEIPAVTSYTRDKAGDLHCRIYCDMAPVFGPL